MPEPDVMSRTTPLNGAELAAGMRQLGVRRGTVLMVHARLSSLGWLAGGTEAAVRALQAAVGEDGTLCAQVSWEDIPFGIDGWPEPWRAAYEAAPVAFDPAVAEAGHFEGRLAERLRTWPGAHRSTNPDTGIVALGARAGWLADPHPFDDGFGTGTPYARLVEARGQVLLLGAPLHSISLLHHAEAIAELPARWRVRYRVPVRHGDGVLWRSCEDIDVRRGPVPYERVVPAGEPPLGHIARAALGSGIGVHRRIGPADCHLFAAADLTRFACAWLEDHFGA